MQREIKRLRSRFVLIVILIVTLMMGIIYAAVCRLAYAGMNEQSTEILENIIESPAQFGVFKRYAGNVQLPYLVVDIDDSFAIIRSYGGYYDISDTNSIADALSYVCNSPDDEGSIEAYSLKYIKTKNITGSYTVAFVDVSSQIETMRNIRIVSLISCLGGVLIFALLALLLSKWVVKPVESSWRLQKQFISDASHELKTPLTVISTNAEMLQMENCSDEDKIKYTDNIVTVSHQMRMLVEDMLNLTRIEKGESDCFEKFDFSELVNNTVMQFEPILFEDGFELKADIKDNIVLLGNRQRLGQLASILLDNASKYSKSKDIILTLNIQSKYAVLSVSNESEILSEEQLKNIFKRFYRVDSSHSEKGSFGLGLPIAQGICAAHNGNIHAEMQGNRIVFIAKIALQN